MPESMTMQQTVPYRVIRSKRRTICLQITREGEVVVRAPLRCGEERIASFVQGHEAWIRRHLVGANERRERFAVSAEEEARLRMLAHKILPEKTAYFAERMGVSPTSVKITSAKARFGSCNGRNGICYSWRLMQMPEPAIDYVVVHELAHIREHNHSPAFYRVIAAEMPDYREREKMLRQ